MPGLKLQVTTAGRAALVNAGHTGANAVQVAQVGIASAPFVMSAALTALPNEVKRIATVGGSITAADTIHVSIRDESTAVYDCYGFGLYLADGTLFANYSQPELLLGKAAAAMMLLAMDAVFVDIDVQQLSFGATNFTDPAATTEVPGIVELATEEEATTGTDKIRAVTAYLLQKVLDTRLGSGAPSAFVKGLLGLSSAAMLRTSLEIKSAALKDEGPDKGLDADLLDGQHGAWYREFSNLQGVPATATAWPTWDQVQTKPATFPPAVHTHDWSQVTGKPATYPPTTHTHSEYVAKSGDTMTGRLGIASYIGWVNASSGQQRYYNDFSDTQWNLNTCNDDGSYRSTVLYFRRSDGFAGFAGSASFGGSLAAAGAALGSGGLTVNSYVKTVGANVRVTGPYPLVAFCASGRDEGQEDAIVGSWSGTTFMRHWPSATDHSSNSDFSIGHAVGIAYWRGASKLFSVDTGGVLTAGTIVSQNDVRANTNYLTTNGYWVASCISGSCTILFRPNGVGNSAGQMALGTSGAVDIAGACRAAGGFDFGSSLTLKDVHGPMPYGLEELDQLDTVIGRYKPAYNEDGRDRLFLIAEQLLALMPEAVDAEGVTIGEEKAPSIKIDQLLPVFVRAIQQLSTRTRDLQAQVSELRSLCQP